MLARQERNGGAVTDAGSPPGKSGITAREGDSPHTSARNPRPQRPGLARARAQRAARRFEQGQTLRPPGLRACVRAQRAPLALRAIRTQHAPSRPELAVSGARGAGHHAGTQSNSGNSARVRYFPRPRDPEGAYPPAPPPPSARVCPTAPRRLAPQGAAHGQGPVPDFAPAVWTDPNTLANARLASSSGAGISILGGMAGGHASPLSGSMGSGAGPPAAPPWPWRVARAARGTRRTSPLPSGQTRIPSRGRSCGRVTST